MKLTREHLKHIWPRAQGDGDTTIRLAVLRELLESYEATLPKDNNDDTKNGVADRIIDKLTRAGFRP